MWKVSLSRLAFRRDAAAMLLDDFVNDEQPESRALAHVLGGEKRVKNARQDVRRNAVAIVVNRISISTTPRPALQLGEEP